MRRILTGVALGLCLYDSIEAYRELTGGDLLTAMSYVGLAIITGYLFVKNVTKI